MNSGSSTAVFETPTRNATLRFKNREGMTPGQRLSTQASVRSPSQRLKDLFFATYTSGVDPVSSPKSASTSTSTSKSFYANAAMQTPTKAPQRPMVQDAADMDDSMDVDSPMKAPLDREPEEPEEPEEQELRDMGMTEDDLRGPAVPLAISTTGRFYSDHMRRCELRIELLGLNTMGHNPRGIYVMPSLGSINVWYGVMFVKRGYWRDAVVRFRIDIPREYPRTHPIIRLSTSVSHPLVRLEDGRFALEQQFPQWTPYTDFIYHALHYFKNAFKNRVLRQLQPKDCYNIGAYMKFKNDLPQFREHARVDSLKSRIPETLYRAQPSDCPIVFSQLSEDQYTATIQQMKAFANQPK
ncbi:hypothetical protein GGI07_002973 [Coemansia sp. Benny D115]|nr:hypothetical protein GGI07_002973 [Coemansia sp. Benny D115]